MNKNDGDGDDDDDDADDAGSGGGGRQQQRESGRKSGREEDEDRLFERQLILRFFSPFFPSLPSLRVLEEMRRRKKKTRLCRCWAMPLSLSVSLSVNCMFLAVDCRLELISAGDQPSESKGEWVKTFSVYSSRRRRRRRLRLSSEKRPWNV